MVEEWEITAHKMVDEILSLKGDHRLAMKYFLTYRSVGDLLAIKELKEKYGINEAEDVILDLMNMRLLEKGEGCINLPSPLRRYVGRKRARINL
ncbi:MAG: hypothetical protein F7B60_04590 [Desulfurococcales archaeon]|nr:hypothetical protein [Desulfurococcales archaeon]